MRLAALALSSALACAASADDCSATRSDEGIFGNDYLQVGVPPDGTLVFKPGGPGFVDRDGALGIKFGWNRLVPGRLQVGGRRLDGEAPPARMYLSDYGEHGFQATYLVFPTPGCWEITGGIGEARLTFVVLVTKIGAGPDWQFEGLQRGWRETSSPELSP